MFFDINGKVIVLSLSKNENASGHLDCDDVNKPCAHKKSVYTLYFCFSPFMHICPGLLNCPGLQNFTTQTTDRTFNHYHGYIISSILEDICVVANSLDRKAKFTP